MYAGRIVEYADVVKLFTNPKHPYTVGLMESIPRMDVPISDDKLLKTIPGVVPSLLDLPEGCHFRQRCPEAVDACTKKCPALLDIGAGHLVRCWLYE
jgi:oligopeptide/dipeptide ABC transporter ATP-binding protein